MPRHLSLEDYYGTPKSPRNKEFKNNPHKDKIILGVFETQEEAIAHEIYLHKLWDVDKNPHFANQAKQTSTAFKYSQSGENHHGYGKPLSNEIKARLSKVMKGRFAGSKNPMYSKTHTAEAKKKIGDARIGKPLSEETKQKLSEALSGENNYFYGKNHTTESKKKISDSRMGKYTAQDNPHHDQSRCLWYNEVSCVSETLTPYELSKKYNLNRSAVTSLKKGRLKNFKGWVYKGLVS